MISKTEEKSHFTKSVFVKESVNSSKDVIMTVNHGETNEFNLNSNSSNTGYETIEKHITVQNENIEDASITKKSALQFFKNAIEDNKIDNSSSTNTIVSSPTIGPYRTESPAEKSHGSNSFSSIQQTYNVEKTVSESDKVQQSYGSEIVLEPGPPPTFDYMPRVQQTVKKDQMTERLKRLSTNQKLLSPEQIPSGAVRIFPDVTSKVVHQEAVTEESCVKKEVIKSGFSDDTLKKEPLAPPSYSEHHGPLLRPRADIEVRPGSPRPSAEAISMEKLWTKSHSPSAGHVQTSYSPVQTKTFSSSESQSFVSEKVERNGELIKNERREEKQGSLNIDDGVKKVSESFSEISVGPTKHVEPPRAEIKRPASANFFNQVASKESFSGSTMQMTKRFSEELSQVKTSSSFDLQQQANVSGNVSKNSFTVKSPEQKFENNQPVYERNFQRTPQFLPERPTGPFKHVEPPKNDKSTSNFTRSHSEETTTAREKQWIPQPQVVAKGPATTQNKSFSSVEARSSFSTSLEKDGVLVASERKEEGGRIFDDGVQRTYDSFSERSKLPTKLTDLSKNPNKSNSIKTMQKMFEQTGSSSTVSNVVSSSSHSRPYSRMKSRASDSDFESEAELSKYNVEQKVPENFSSNFETKMYSSKTQVQEIKSTSSKMMMMQSPVKESGYVADTDEPRSFQSEVTANHHQTVSSSKRTSGFPSSLLKKVG